MPKANLATTSKLVELFPTAADAAGRQSRIVNLRNATYASLVALISQGNAAPVTLTVMQALDTAGTGAKPISGAVPIWANQDTSLTDTLVRQPDGLSFTTSAALKNKQVVFHIDPANLDVNNGYKTVFVTTSASNAANVTGGLALLAVNRYQEETIPSAIID